jgi:hypothetical protein
MTAAEHVELMKGDLPFHLRNTVTIGTGQVTELRIAAADEIDRLNLELRDLKAQILGVAG